MIMCTQHSTSHTHCRPRQWPVHACANKPQTGLHARPAAQTFSSGPAHLRWAGTTAACCLHGAVQGVCPVGELLSGEVRACPGPGAEVYLRPVTQHFVLSASQFKAHVRPFTCSPWECLSQFHRVSTMAIPASPDRSMVPVAALLKTLGPDTAAQLTRPHAQRIDLCTGLAACSM